jgi:hypothetical protein
MGHFQTEQKRSASSTGSAWFEVDKQGLAKILERKGKEFALLELIQNAWDEPGVSKVVATLEYQGRNRAVLTVEDDAPEGFKNLSHAFTLFAESGKKTNPEQRGRFNLGEKLAVALCDEATIQTAQGGIRFEGKHRHEIGHLYVAEKELRLKKAGPQLRAARRSWQNRPVLQRLRRAMELVRRRTLPHGLLGQAIDYALKRWEALTWFVDDGVLEIDNNACENSIRPSAVGKRNWLIVGHPEARERSAVIYTLLGSCRQHGINPFDYLKDLFRRLPTAKITQIGEFTPAAWARAKAEEQMVAKAA